MKLRALDNPVLFAQRMLGVQLHDGQASFLLDSHVVRVLIGGRRSGKGYALAVLIVWMVVVHAVQGQPLKVLIAAPTIDQARVLLDYVLRLLRGSPLLTSLIRRHVESPFPQVEVGETVIILVRSLAERGRHLRGHGRDLGLAVLDEAFLVDETTVKEVVAPLLADRGGILAISSTATAPQGSYLHQLFERGMKGDPRVGSHHFRSLDNPFVSREYILAQKEEISEEQWKVEWLGEFSSAINSVFAWDKVVACSEDHAGVEAEGGKRFVIGFDPAKVRDRSAVIVLDCSGVPRRIVHLEDLHGHDYVMQAARVAELSRQFRGARVTIDTTNGEALADLLRASGVSSVQPVVFSASKKTELITSLICAVERGDVRFAPDERLLSEFRFFQAKRTPVGTIRYEATNQGHDDFICALALSLYGAGAVLRSRPPAPDVLPPFIGGAFSVPPSAVVSAPGGLDERSWSEPWSPRGGW